MKKIIILGLITIGFSGASLNNHAGTPIKSKKTIIVEDTSAIEQIPDKMVELDSLLKEINKHKND